MTRKSRICCAHLTEFSPTHHSGLKVDATILNGRLWWWMCNCDPCLHYSWSCLSLPSGWRARPTAEQLWPPQRNSQQHKRYVGCKGRGLVPVWAFQVKMFDSFNITVNKPNQTTHQSLCELHKAGKEWKHVWFCHCSGKLSFTDFFLPSSLHCVNIFLK